MPLGVVANDLDEASHGRWAAAARGGGTRSESSEADAWRDALEAACEASPMRASASGEICVGGAAPLWHMVCCVRGRDGSVDWAAEGSTEGSHIDDCVPGR